MTDSVTTDPIADPWIGIGPQTLDEDMLSQRAWRMPDILIYQHGPEEWWVAPLDEELPSSPIKPHGRDLARRNGWPHDHRSLAESIRQMGV